MIAAIYVGGGLFTFCVTAYRGMNFSACVVWALVWPGLIVTAPAVGLYKMVQCIAGRG